MLITDLIEALYKIGGEEIEFHLINADGSTVKLDLAVGPSGKYLYKTIDENDKETSTIILGLETIDFSPESN